MAAAVQEADWDLTPYFDAIEGDAYRAFRAALAADVAKLQADADALVDALARLLPPMTG